MCDQVSERTSERSAAPHCLPLVSPSVFLLNAGSPIGLHCALAAENVTEFWLHFAHAKCSFFSLRMRAPVCATRCSRQLTPFPPFLHLRPVLRRSSPLSGPAARAILAGVAAATQCRCVEPEGGRSSSQASRDSPSRKQWSGLLCGCPCFGSPTRSHLAAKPTDRHPNA